MGYNCRFEVLKDDVKSVQGKLIIGENCKFGDRVHISTCSYVHIDDNCLCASNVLITDNMHGSYKGVKQSSPCEAPDARVINARPVKIGKNVWIGENVVILPGVTIGDGVVIGANSVVTNNVKENTIICGSPARILKEWSGEQWERI